MATCTIDGVSIAYELIGDGLPTVVIRVVGSERTPWNQGAGARLPGGGTGR